MAAIYNPRLHWVHLLCRLFKSYFQDEFGLNSKMDGGQRQVLLKLVCKIQVLHEVIVNVEQHTPISNTLDYSFAECNSLCGVLFSEN